MEFSKGTSERLKARIKAAVGAHGSGISKYLGLPIYVSRSKKELFKGIRDRLEKRLFGWKNQNLSKAGREVLVKSIAQSIPTYSMSLFKLPGSYNDELQAAVNRFWWGHKGTEKKIHWCSAEKLSKPKTEGGLGFRNFRMFNWALLGKQGWRILNNEQSLMARIMRAKYFEGKSFLEADLGSHPSYIWRSIWEARWVLKKGMRWRVGNGRSINVWNDPWIEANKNYLVTSPSAGKDPSLTVDRLLLGAAWNGEALSKNFLPYEVERIRSIPVSLRFPPDTLTWGWSKDGDYSVRSAYRGITEVDYEADFPESSRSDQATWNHIWSAKTTPRVRMLAWTLCSDALPSNARLASRVPDHDPSCPICGREREEDIHIFRECGKTKKIWKMLGLDIETHGSQMRDWLFNCFERLKAEKFALFLTTLCGIWDRRNSWVFNGIFKENQTLTETALAIVDTNAADPKIARTTKEPQSATWKSPPRGWAKLNVDTSVQEGRGTGFGICIRDDFGLPMGTMTVQEAGCLDPLAGEATAMVKGLHMAASLRIPKLVVETDCIQLVELIKIKGGCRFGPVYNIIQDILSIGSQWNCISWVYAPRMSNSVAHELARQIPWEVGIRVWGNSLPDAVRNLMLEQVSNGRE